MHHGHQVVEVDPAVRQGEGQPDAGHVFGGEPPVGIGTDRTRLDEPGDVLGRRASLARQTIGGQRAPRLEVALVRPFGPTHVCLRQVARSCNRGIGPTTAFELRSQRSVAHNLDLEQQASPGQ